MKPLLLFSFFLLLTINTFCLEKPTATIYHLNAGETIIIDGYIDEIWDNVEPNSINKIFINDSLPTINSATWKAVWNDTAIIVLVAIDDDNIWIHPLELAMAGWSDMDDQDIYLDLNDTLLDEGGAFDQLGHYEIGRSYPELDTAKMLRESNGYYDGFRYDYENADIFVEYAIPFNKIPNHLGFSINPLQQPTIGFDVNINDADEISLGEYPYRRLAWSNNQSDSTNWRDMDSAGTITFSNENILAVPQFPTNLVHEILAFPNPVRDILSFAILVDEACIYNSLGQFVMRKNTAENQVDINNLTEGLYLIRLFSDNKLVGSQWIIKE